MADRPARVEITADSRSLGAGLREAASKLAGFAATSARVVGRYGAASALTLGGAAKDVGAGFLRLGQRAMPYLGRAALGAGAALAYGAVKVRDFEEGLIRLRINASATEAEIEAVRRSVRRASADTGVGSRLILSGIQEYVDLTGDFAGATKQVATFARTAQAADAAVADVAGTAAAMRDALKIDPTEMEAAFSAMIAQGKAGSITMKQLAAELPQLAPTIAQFKGGTGLSGLRELGAMIQVLNKRYNSASESATAFQALAVAVQSRASNLRAAGIKVFDVGPDGIKRPRELLEIIDEVSRSSLYKDPQKLFKAFGRAEAVEALQQIVRLRKEVDALVKAGQDTGAVGRDIKTYQASRAGKLAKIENDVKETLQGVVVAGVDGLDKVAHGAALMFGGGGAEAAATNAYVAQLDRRQYQLMFEGMRRGQPLTREQALAQIASEDAAYQGLRQGTFDWRNMDWVKTQQQRVTEGNYSNRDQLLFMLEVLARRITERDNAAAFKQAIKEGIAESGLLPVVKIGGDAVLGAVRSSTGHARRP